MDLLISGVLWRDYKGTCQVLAENEDGSGAMSAATAGFSVNGMRNQSNNFLLDGIDNNEYTFNTVIIAPSVEQVREFKVLSGVFSAEDFFDGALDSLADQPLAGDAALGGIPGSNSNIPGLPGYTTATPAPSACTGIRCVLSDDLRHVHRVGRHGRGEAHRLGDRLAHLRAEGDLGGRAGARSHRQRAHPLGRRRRSGSNGDAAHPGAERLSRSRRSVPGRRAAARAGRRHGARRPRRTAPGVDTWTER